MPALVLVLLAILLTPAAAVLLTPAAAEASGGDEPWWVIRSGYAATTELAFDGPDGALTITTSGDATRSWKLDRRLWVLRIGVRYRTVLHTIPNRCTATVLLRPGHRWRLDNTTCPAGVVR